MTNEAIRHLRKGEVPHLNQVFRCAGMVFWVQSVTLRNRSDWVTTPDLQLIGVSARRYRRAAAKEAQR